MKSKSDNNNNNNNNEPMSLAAVKAPATFVGQALQELTGNGMDLLAKQGNVPVQKVSSRGKFLPRFLSVSQDRFVLFVTTTPLLFHKPWTKKRLGDGHVLSKLCCGGGGCDSKPHGEAHLRYIDVADFTGLHVGVIGTRTLEQARTHNRLKGHDSKVDERRAQMISLLFHGNVDSLNLYVPNAEHVQPLVQALRQLRATYHCAKVWVSNEALLLRYIWLDMDVDRTGGISLGEFRRILPRINLYVEFPRREFRNYLRNKANNNNNNRQHHHLSYAQLMDLLQQLKRQQEGNRAATPTASDLIWEQHFGANTTTVSAQDFLTQFLHASQHMTDLTLVDAKALIETLCTMERYSLGSEPNVPSSSTLSPTKSREGDEGRVADQVLTLRQFEIYLLDSLNAAYDPAALRASPRPNDNFPLSHYWINSSHNTYLTGDQLRSNSSVECYLRALQRGCKCLELDVWDGVEDNNNKTYWPVIFHGHTLTSKILFRDVVAAVAAYLKSYPESYPVVLSLENHCSLPFQEQMAKDLEELLGDALYIPNTTEDDQELPTPRELKGKVVIKGKRPPEKDEDDDETEEEEEADGATGDGDDDAEKKAGEDATKEAQGGGGGGEEEEGVEIDGDKVMERKDKDKTDDDEPEFSPALARMTLLHGSKYKNFEQSMEMPAGYMHSISESKIPKLLGTSRRKRREENESLAEAWRDYNTGHMTRTYPKGSRVDSSNYNPMLAWSVGSQLVALNFQTPDAPLILNDGRFREQQRCGYILKPTSVMPNASRDHQDEEETSNSKDGGDEEERFEGFQDFVVGVPPDSGDNNETPSAGTLISERWHAPRDKITNNDQPFKIRFRVWAGSCLPKPLGAKTGETIDPYVKVTLYDINTEENTGKLSLNDQQRLETKTIDNNGFCPMWSDEASSTKEFSVESPQVALLLIQLLERDSFNADDRVAETAIPVQRLRMGFRSIQLYDLNNERAGPFDYASLLVEIQTV